MRILFLFLLIYISSSLRGQDTAIIKNSISTSDKVEKYAKQLDYEKKKKAWVLKQNERNSEDLPLKSIPLIEKAFEYLANIVIILLLGVILYFIYMAYKKRSKKDFAKIKNIDPLHIDDIEATDLEAMLVAALQEKDYRLALRIKFLKILQSLQSKKMIEWSPEKTNRAYLYEVNQPEIKKDLQNVISYFDRIWYGHAYINENEYNQYGFRFDHLQSKLSV